MTPFVRNLAHAASRTSDGASRSCSLGSRCSDRAFDGSPGYPAAGFHQRWISLGAAMKDDVRSILPKAILDQFPSPGLSDWSTDDAWGASRINFDGWRYVGFPLPGNYPGEGYPWPANCNWRSDKDGRVHYPLTLRKLVIELPEKVLHLTTWAPPPRSEVFLSDLVVAQGDNVMLKNKTPE